MRILRQVVWLLFVAATTGSLPLPAYAVGPEPAPLAQPVELTVGYQKVGHLAPVILIADDLKKNGGYIPGVRPGQATSSYLHNAISRITLAGAIALTLIAVIPILLRRWINIPGDVANFFGGTSMLIIVGVLLDTMRQMESHLMMRHYDGFLRGGRGGRSGPRMRGRL